MKKVSALLLVGLAGHAVLGDAVTPRLAGFGRIDNPAPTVSSISPKAVPAGAAGQILTINGHNFLSSSTVMFNGAPHPAAFISATRLSVQLRQTDLFEPGSFPVVVVNPPPGGGTSTTAHFVVESPNRQRAAQ
jgi:hypothetical protein